MYGEVVSQGGVQGGVLCVAVLGDHVIFLQHSWSLFPNTASASHLACSDQDGSLQEDPHLMSQTHRASPVTLPAPSASSSSNLHLISFQIPSSSGHWARELTYSSWETWMTLYYYARCRSQAETVQTSTTKNGVCGFSTVDQVPRQALSHGPRG